MFDLEVQPLPAVSVPAPTRAFLFVVLAPAVFFDVGVRGGVTNVFVAAGCGLVVLVLLRTDHRLTTSGRALLLGALLPIMMLVLRASPWLAASNAGAIGALVGSGVLYHRTGSFFDATPTRWIRRAGAGAVASISAWRIFEPIIRATHNRRKASQIGRGQRAALVAAPFIVGTVLLLQAGDAVFAEFVTPDIDLGPAAGHGFLVALFVVGIVALRSSTELTVADIDHHGAFGVLEVLTMLGLAASVLVLFVASQLVAVTSVGDRLVRATGMTPAQYARSGFFQLCWATLAIVVLLVLIRRLATPVALRDRRVRLLAAAVPMLALGLVVVSLSRMARYDDVINPEAFIVRHNAERSRTGANIDLGYLGSLSDDAVPQIVETFERHMGTALLRNTIHCRRHIDGVTGFNLSVDAATGVRRTLCPTSSASRPTDR